MEFRRDRPARDEKETRANRLMSSRGIYIVIEIIDANSIGIGIVAGWNSSLIPPVFSPRSTFYIAKIRYQEKNTVSGLLLPFIVKCIKIGRGFR